MTQIKDFFGDNGAAFKDFLRMHQWVLIVIIFLAIIGWALKLFTLWKAARNKSVAWFIVLAFINTAGVLPLIYILTHKREP
jgi:predicted membrane channel-forming protein YqfA (hemolysin III family)